MEDRGRREKTLPSAPEVTLIFKGQVQEETWQRKWDIATREGEGK